MGLRGQQAAVSRVQGALVVGAHQVQHRQRAVPQGLPQGVPARRLGRLLALHARERELYTRRYLIDSSQVDSLQP